MSSSSSKRKTILDLSPEEFKRLRARVAAAKKAEAKTDSPVLPTALASVVADEAGKVDEDAVALLISKMAPPPEEKPFEGARFKDPAITGLLERRSKLLEEVVHPEILFGVRDPSKFTLPVETSKAKPTRSVGKVKASPAIELLVASWADAKANKPPAPVKPTRTVGRVKASKEVEDFMACKAQMLADKPPPTFVPEKPTRTPGRVKASKLVEDFVAGQVQQRADAKQPPLASDPAKPAPTFGRVKASKALEDLYAGLSNDFAAGNVVNKPSVASVIPPAVMAVPPPPPPFLAAAPTAVAYVTQVTEAVSVPVDDDALFKANGAINMTAFRRVWDQRQDEERGSTEVEYNRHFPRFVRSLEHVTKETLEALYSRMGPEFIDECEAHWMAQCPRSQLTPFPVTACQDEKEVVRIHKVLGDAFFTSMPECERPLAYRFYLERGFAAKLMRRPAPVAEPIVPRRQNSVETFVSQPQSATEQVVKPDARPQLEEAVVLQPAAEQPASPPPLVEEHSSQPPTATAVAEPPSRPQLEATVASPPQQAVERPASRPLSVEEPPSQPQKAAEAVSRKESVDATAAGPKLSRFQREALAWFSQPACTKVSGVQKATFLTAAVAAAVKPALTVQLPTPGSTPKRTRGSVIKRGPAPARQPEPERFILGKLAYQVQYEALRVVHLDSGAKRHRLRPLLSRLWHGDGLSKGLKLRFCRV